MSTAEIKTEIDKVLDTLPEDALESVLDYLKSITHTTKEKLAYSKNLRKILEEDRELLEKLAQ